MEAPGPGFPGLPGGLQLQRREVPPLVSVGTVHLSSRKSTLCNWFLGLWPRAGCVIILLNQSVKASRDKRAPGRVRPAEGAPTGEGRSALCHP